MKTFDDVRRQMKKEIVPHRNGTGPKNRYSENRLNAMARTVELKYGSSAARELHKEMTSKRR